jgi:GNAT superfamily N-acetyltransferase
LWHNRGMSIRLRTAGPDDAADIHRLIVDLATYEREPDAVEVSPAQLRAQLAADRPPFECLVAEVEGAVVGFALYFHNYSTWRGRPGLYLEDLYVSPAQRGLGVGRRLLAALARIAVDRGCARMEWNVLAWNAPAIEFYERIGAGPVAGWQTYRMTDAALASLARESEAHPDLR